MPQCRFCSYSARWDGLCLSCYQRSGRMDQRREEERQRVTAERLAQQQRAATEALDSLLTMGDQQLPWWDISERLNRAGHRNDGRPWTPSTARGVYVAKRGDEWE